MSRLPRLGIPAVAVLILAALLLDAPQEPRPREGLPPGADPPLREALRRGGPRGGPERTLPPAPARWSWCGRAPQHLLDRHASSPLLDRDRSFAQGEDLPGVDPPELHESWYDLDPAIRASKPRRWIRSSSACPFRRRWAPTCTRTARPSRPTTSLPPRRHPQGLRPVERRLPGGVPGPGRGASRGDLGPRASIRRGPSLAEVVARMG